MQALEIRNDTLVEIGTFLVRRWSEKKDVTIEFSEKNEAKTRIKDNRIILLPIGKLQGDDFQRYRQFRTTLWYESMRLKFCKKILSNDHAFGFILNTLETRRIELLGRKIWKGMDEELIFNYSYQWNYRPLLNTVYGKARVVEGFYQYFLFGDIKGEIAANQFER
ncbi:MAG: VWA domain-containing protein, partial [Nitrosopumilaceae archaeon]|nr:VWA domain-containing protein [Nitrosopumilaceae archaeon]